MERMRTLVRVGCCMADRRGGRWVEKGAAVGAGRDIYNSRRSADTALLVAQERLSRSQGPNQAGDPRISRRLPIEFALTLAPEIKRNSAGSGSESAHGPRPPVPLRADARATSGTARHTAGGCWHPATRPPGAHHGHQGEHHAPGGRLGRPCSRSRGMIAAGAGPASRPPVPSRGIYLR